MMLPIRRRPVGRRPSDRDDGGFAMVTAVIVSALIVSITGALALSLTSGGRESARQRELYEARAAGVSALEYLYAQLGNNPFFFNEMLSRNFPTTHDWIALSTTTGPDPGTNGHWRQFNRDLTTRECPARLDTCWTMRVKSDGSRDPRAVAVETIVRFDCRGSGYCSVRRFQQQMRRTAELGHAWQRSDLTEVTSGAALPTVSITTTTTTTTTVAPTVPGQVQNLQVTSNISAQISLGWEAPADGGAVDTYVIQWKSGTQDYSASRQRTTTGTSVAITSGLTSGTQYDIQVFAQNTHGDGSPAEVTVTAA